VIEHLLRGIFVIFVLALPQMLLVTCATTKAELKTRLHKKNRHYQEQNTNIFRTNNKFVISHLCRSNLSKILPDMLVLFAELEIGIVRYNFKKCSHWI
jgi:hypothetical protein